MRKKVGANELPIYGSGQKYKRFYFRGFDVAPKNPCFYLFFETLHIPAVVWQALSHTAFWVAERVISSSKM